ncbi:MAG: peptide chain release factor N(5)-glutamine methyltransferase [Gammaproteobacteria bacterium]|nr:MAG: peptide chain release factor N(5)-glutamine methyltransferase [Gammaproteobacteria bacterium]
MSPTLAGWLERHAELPDSDRDFLLCHHLGVERAALRLEAARPIEPDLWRALEADAARLSAGEPLAYVLGEWSFWDFDLAVSPAVLVPRPETETLVEAALDRACPGDRILDLGTGSGAIAIALARAKPLQVVAVDASAAALEIARSNATSLDTQVTFLESDWFSAVPDCFDLIVSNPPYVAAEDPHLPALAHEPRSALVSGPEGLDDLRRIIAQAPAHLNLGGWLLVEHGYDQAEAVGSLFAQAGFEAIECLADLGGRPRVTLGRRQHEA